MQPLPRTLTVTLKPELVPICKQGDQNSCIVTQSIWSWEHEQSKKGKSYPLSYVNTIIGDARLEDGTVKFSHYGIRYVIPPSAITLMNGPWSDLGELVRDFDDHDPEGDPFLDYPIKMKINLGNPDVVMQESRPRRDPADKLARPPKEWTVVKSKRQYRPCKPGDQERAKFVGSTSELKKEYGSDYRKEPTRGESSARPPEERYRMSARRRRHAAHIGAPVNGQTQAKSKRRGANG